MLSLLESNEIHNNAYKVQTPAFEVLFQKFRAFYQDESAKKTNKDISFELVKIEQAIHLITDISATQDVSAYLDLVSKIDSDYRLSEIIILLHKKHSSWQSGYSEGYLHWMEFLSPYIHFLMSIKENYHKIVSLNSKEAENIAREYLVKLRDLAVKGKNEWDDHIANNGSTKQLLKALSDFKNSFIKESLQKDHQFYYGLGLLSLITLLLKYSISKDYILLKTCLAASLYSGKDHILLLFSTLNR